MKKRKIAGDNHYGGGYVMRPRSAKSKALDVLKTDRPELSSFKRSLRRKTEKREHSDMKDIKEGVNE